MVRGSRFPELSDWVSGFGSIEPSFRKAAGLDVGISGKE